MERGRDRKEAKRMKLTVEEQEGVTVLVLPTTALTTHEAGDLKTECEPFLIDNCKVLVGLSGVGFVDSAGCAALLFLHRRARDKRGDLRICGVSSSVRALFDQLRVARVIPIHGSRDEAIRLLNGR
jgi:anti-anti-sigma factor